MGAERIWTVVRFPNGSWSYGGSPHSPDYEHCEVWRITAATAEKAVKKAQAKRRRDARKPARGVEARPVTQQEDQWLHDAAKRSSKVVAPGKLVEKCDFPACAVHHICTRNCERNAGVQGASNNQEKNHG